MKLVCLYGSPRKKGNSALMLDAFIESARSAGAEVASWHLNDLSMKGCQACYACKKKSETCVVPDDIPPVLAAAAAADGLVIASPVYYGDVSAQVKIFIDRTFSWLRPDYTTRPDPSRLAPGKKLAFLISQGQPDPDSFKDIHPRYAYFFQWMGFQDMGAVRALGVNRAVEVAQREGVLEEVRRLAVRMVTGK